MFKNYRQNWRNPSTHEYDLFFSQEEATLALTSVSAFILVLSNQIFEKVYSDEETKIVTENLPQIKKSIENYESLSLNEKVINLLLHFNSSQDISIESALSGVLSGYLPTIDNEFSILRNPPIKIKDQVLRPDFIIQKNTEKIILELKFGPRRSDIKFSVDRMFNFLIRSKITKGILFCYDGQQNTRNIERRTRNENGIEYEVNLIN